MKEKRPIRRRSVLAERERKVLAYLEDYLWARGVPPTVREIAEALGIGSTATVAASINELEAGGFIRREPGRARSLRLLIHRPRKPRGVTTAVPILPVPKKEGDFWGGVPRGFLHLDRSLAGNSTAAAVPLSGSDLKGLGASRVLVVVGREAAAPDAVCCLALDGAAVSGVLSADGRSWRVVPFFSGTAKDVRRAHPDVWYLGRVVALITSF